MTKFAEVEMPITTPGDKAALALLRELDRRAQETARNGGAAASSAIVQVQSKSATAARSIAGNIAMIAAAGEATAGSLKGILAQGANIAFMFGATGAIGGAIALTGLAIYNLFNRTRAEIEATALKARQELEKIARAGDLGSAAQRAQYLFSGDPFAAAFGKHEGESDAAFERRRLGLQGIQAAIAEQERRRAGAAGGGALDQQRRTAAYNEIFRLREQERLLRQEYEATIPVVQKLAAAEGERAAFQLQQLREATEKERGDLLGRLLSGGRPENQLLGKPYATANLLDLSDSMLKGIQERLRKAPPIPTTELTPELERILNAEMLAENIGNSFGATLAESIAAGFANIFEGGRFGARLENGFRAMAGAVLRGLGSVFQQIGITALAGMKLIATIKDAISSWAPGLGIPAALGLIALGAVLQAGGNSLANSGQGGVGGGGGYASNTGQTVINRGIINPLNQVVTNPASIQARPTINLFATIIGKNDASAQRDLVDMVKLGLSRSGEKIGG